MSSFEKKRRNSGPVSLRETFAAMVEDPRAKASLGLRPLWRDWDMVAGEFSQWVKPVGHKGRELRLGVSDAVAMAEAHYLGLMLVDAANAYLGEPRFDSFHLELLDGRPTLADRIKNQPPPTFLSTSPKLSGISHRLLTDEGPVGRAYRAALARSAQTDADNSRDF